MPRDMNPQQLRVTAMDPKSRSLTRVILPEGYRERNRVRDLVDRLMGRNPEHRLASIQRQAADVDAEAIDA